MSVTIAASPQPATFWQRLTGTEPKTVVTETSTTTITNDPGGSFNLKTALRNGGIGAAIAGALGGVSLIGKVALPVIGKVASLGGLAKLAGVGGAIGVATAALPLIAPKVKESPAAKAALLGAGIGAAAGAVLPLMPVWLGASIGAGVGLLVHGNKHRRNDYPVIPGYQAYPGFHPVGVTPNGHVPSGLVPVTPNYGSYAGTAMNPYGTMSGYGMVPAGYGMAAPAGYGAMPMGYGTMLPAQAAAPAGAVPVAAQAQVPVAAPAQASAPAAELPPVETKQPAAKKASKNPNAKTFKDSKGNIRQIGTGKIVKPSAATLAAAQAAATTPNVQGGFATGYGLDMGAQPQGLVDSTLASVGIQNTGLAGLAGLQQPALAAQQLANGTTPLPDATQMTAGVQPAVLPQLPGM